MDTKKANDLLRWQREIRGWSLQKVADELEKLGGGTDSKQVGKWERGTSKPSPFYREKLCLLFNTTADVLGFIEPRYAEPVHPIVVNQPLYVRQTQQPIGDVNEQDNSALSMPQSIVHTSQLGDVMTKFSSSRRGFLETALAGLSIASLPLGDERPLTQYEKLNDVAWELSNTNQLEMAEQVLSIYLPKASNAAHQSSLHQAYAASIVARGYILAAEIDKQSVGAMQNYAQQAVFYSRFTNDYSVMVDALRQEATIALVAKQPLKALLSYQKAVPLLDKVSALLRSRMYLGLASAFARCNPVLYKQDALRCLGLANEHFPAKPEGDPWYLYMHASGSQSVVHLYEALTYNDLNQPKEAWSALAKVDGLNPKLAVTESSRLEFLNLQAKTVAMLGNMEESCAYLQASVTGADATGYSVWREEAADVYRDIVRLWPHEFQVRRLSQLFEKKAS